MQTDQFHTAAVTGHPDGHGSIGADLLGKAATTSSGGIHRRLQWQVEKEF